MASPAPMPSDASPHGPQPVAQLEDVSHIFGATAVLRHLSLTLEPGSALLLLGENGAGKSTLLRVLAGLLRPRFGSVRIFGTSAYAARARIGYMAHAPMLYGEFTATENLEYFARLYGPEACLPSEEALRAVGLDPANASPVRQYSQGMRQRVSLARALLARPGLLLLDEPFSNMDRTSALAMLALLRHERARGCAIVLTTHHRELAEPLADTIALLADGQLTGDDSR